MRLESCLKMPEITKGVLIKKVNLAGSYWLFSLEFTAVFSFLSGQYVSIKVADDGSRRSYSIASAPGGKVIEMLVDVGPMGLGSKFFLSLTEGDAVEVMGPMGIFILATEKVMNNKMFIATGSGIAPMMSMIGDLLKNKKHVGEIKLVWGMRHEEDLFWMDEWKKLKEGFPNFSYEVVLSKPGEHWHGSCGHVGDCLREGFIVNVASLSGWEFYLCGGQEMIRETGGYLVGKGVAKEDIHFEKFF